MKVGKVTKSVGKIMLAIFKGLKFEFCQKHGNYSMNDLREMKKGKESPENFTDLDEWKGKMALALHTI
jgi:hypothetical protein